MGAGIRSTMYFGLLVSALAAGLFFALYLPMDAESRAAVMAVFDWRRPVVAAVLCEVVVLALPRDLMVTTPGRSVLVVFAAMLGLAALAAVPGPHLVTGIGELALFLWVTSGLMIAGSFVRKRMSSGVQGAEESDG